MSHYQSRLAAILGPTNTGKTHYAIERMLARNSGIIGLPLRLLAREVYDKVVALRGLSSVALVTGEERIVPVKARYWVCTVEAMPQDIGAEFVAIDEIQLCGDPERGHVFTDRLLNMRGSMETLFLGADTMRKVIGQLIPNVEFIFRSRFSDLEYTGTKKTSRMPSRSAIVGFSVDNVYAVAELLRRQKGGAAVVMGALSPRTRNAQVELYQNGDVDYLVATDAIGMGLNLDINHVAFSSLTKFDGRRMRYLMPNELAQIAGRAGRHLNSGTFGVTGEAPKLDQEVVEAIENHKFAPLKKLQWRNSRLEFGTTNSLINSLDKSSEDILLIKAQPAEDFRTLTTLVEDGEVSARASDGPSVKLLWETCGIPDFRGVSFTDHTSLVSKIFNFLHEKGEVSEIWLAQKIANIDKTGGDIDTISKRLAEVDTKGEVTIEGEFVGKLNGFRFQMDKDATAEEGKTLRAASIQALQPEFNLRADRMYNAPDTEFEFTEQGGLMWGEYGVGKLIKGDDILSPRIDAFVDGEAGNEVLTKVQKRLRHFMDRKINSAFEPLLAMRDDELVNGMARGLAFRLVESLGVIPRSVVAKDVKELDQDGRGLLRKHGVRFGQYTLFQQLMLKPAPTRLRLVLWSLFEDLDEFPEAPPPGLVTIPETKGSPKGYYPRAGYRLAGDRAIRIDMLERLADLTRTQNVKDGFEANSDMLSISGTTLDQFSNMMEGLGFSVEKSEREKIKPEPQDGNEVKSAEADEDIMETFYIFRWVPKVRPMRKEHSQKEHNKPKKNKKSENTKFKKQSASSVKKDKPLDPDNPFAALLALKGKS